MRKLGFPGARMLVCVAAAVAVLAAACGGGGGIENAEEVVIADRIQFKIPGALDEVGVAGIDSVVAQWESAGLSLLLDYGGSSDSLGYTGKDGYRVTILQIADRDAVIERFMDPGVDAQRPYVAALHFADAGDGNKLTLFGRAATEDDQDVLLDIFDTLKWIDA